MKIIHTSDWHIGKLVHGLHMTEDQRYILKEFVEVVKSENPDVIVISGDIYDRSVPPTEAIKLLDSVLAEILIDLKVKIILLAGNHDNPERLGFASKILKDQGLYIVSKIKDIYNPIVLNDEHGEVYFFVFPYADPSTVRSHYEDNQIKTHQDALAKLLDEVSKEIDIAKRKVAIYHGYVRGVEELEMSDSERPLSLGGTDIVNVDMFSKFNYTALGHLHGAQKIKHENIRYAGSLLKYSFSEHLQKKSVSIVELDQFGNTDIKLVQLKTLRDMRRVKGSLENLIKHGEESDDYIEAILTDQGEIIDAIGKLRAVYPNILSLERESLFEIEARQTSANKDFKSMHPIELFEDFYQNIMGNDLPEGSQDYLTDLWKDIEIEKRQS